jgi:DNA-binding CsgD family transcriptional regulator
MAERLGVEEVAVHAMDSYGSAMACIGDDDGIAVLHEALDRAKRANIVDEVTRTSGNLVEVLVSKYQLAEALVMVDHAIAVATEHELRFSLNYLLGERARGLSLLGRWDDAMVDIATVLAEPDAADPNRCSALLHLGRIRARRGDPGPFEALDEALALALPTTEMQTIHPVRIARAEAAWLAGDQARAAVEVEAAIPLTEAHPEPANVGELAYWARRTGLRWTPVIPVPEPVTQVLAGDARAAAAFWDARSCAYEAADALGDSDDVEDLREAHERLTALGARPRAQQVARSLRDLGARDVPRGPRASTRANAAGLTAREVEVAALLVANLTNGEIAERLVLSPKTVDHHVSAVLSKLAVSNRRHVAEAAAAVGLDLKDGVAAAPT